jgi:pyridinium-3,5-bisthiocarboxylic acid mononucleotide nickel chelatase
MKTAYLDCFSGISGDMLLGALLDIGVPEDHFRQTFAALPLEGYAVTITRQSVQGLMSTKVQVEATHGHHHRHLFDIRNILAQADLPDRISDRSLRVFTRLAEAEAAVHGTSAETVHFHEVGAVDAILDIIGAVAGLDYLAVDRLHCSPLPLSSGWVRCEHGDLPLPGPAVCGLLRNVPVYGVDLGMELVTPTGAALVKELAHTFGPMPPLLLERTGYGAGSLARADGRPNLLRLLLGTTVQVDEPQQVDVIETHIDDWNPEFWPYVSDRLMAAGALDVCLIPVQMKKGRPGFILRVVCEPAASHPITMVIFSETSSLGLRTRQERRSTLPREIITVTTPWGDLQAKLVHSPAGAVVVPEYEACQSVAARTGVPLQAVYDAIRRFSAVNTP